MKISLVTVGKTQDKEIAGVITDYSSRISRYVGFEFVEVEGDARANDRLLKVLDKFDRVFLLDERGREYRSMEFADFMNKQMNSGVKSIAFIVGGPFGFSEEVKDRKSVV